MLEGPSSFLQEIWLITSLSASVILLLGDSEGKKVIPYLLPKVCEFCFEGLLESTFKIPNLPSYLANLPIYLSCFQSLTFYSHTTKIQERGMYGSSFSVLVLATLRKLLPWTRNVHRIWMCIPISIAVLINSLM